MTTNTSLRNCVISATLAATVTCGYSTFASKKQAADQPADDWPSEVRDLARKCEFATANCEPTRILGQVISGVFSDEVRIKLLEQGATLTLDQALLLLRITEAASKESTNLKHGAAAAIQATSTYKQKKQQLKPQR